MVEIMENNVLTMREEEMEEAVVGLNKIYADGDNVDKSIPNNFSGMKKSGLFDVGINTINKQLNSINTSIFNVKSMINNHSTEMFNMDRQLANIANKIAVPQDFVKNNSMQANIVKNVALEKTDGKTVNDGQATSSVNMEDNTIINAQSLGSIVSNLTPEEERLNTATAINRQGVNNINNNQGLTSQDIDTASNIAREALGNINKSQTLSEQSINGDTNITYATLNDINKASDTLAREIDATTSINKKNLDSPSKSVTDMMKTQVERASEVFTQDENNR